MKTLVNLSPVLGIFFLTILSFSDVFGSDTLYFRLSNPWNTIKDQGEIRSVNLAIT